MGDDVIEIKQMTEENVKKAKERFKTYIKMERERLELATARNDLETLIYSSKERLNDNDAEKKEGDAEKKEGDAEKKEDDAEKKDGEAEKKEEETEKKEEETEKKEEETEG